MRPVMCRIAFAGIIQEIDWNLPGLIRVAAHQAGCMDNDVSLKDFRGDLSGLWNLWCWGD